MTANHGHLLRDEESGLDYITDFQTGRRLYKHPLCPLCGIARFEFSSKPLPECSAKCICHPSRRAANEAKRVFA